MKKVLFIDRDGTLAFEPEGYQLDSFDKYTLFQEVKLFFKWYLLFRGKKVKDKQMQSFKPFAIFEF